MANPFKQGVSNAQIGNIGIPNLAPLKDMLAMLNSAQNPQAALNMLAQKNPQVGQVMKMIGGRNPQEVFYSMCKERGINPDDILNQLK